MYNQGEYIVDIILALFVMASYVYAGVYRNNSPRTDMWVGIDKKIWLYRFYNLSIFICFVTGAALFFDDILLKNDSADREILTGWHVLLASAMLWTTATVVGMKYQYLKFLPFIPLAGTVVGACLLLTQYIHNQEWWKVAFGSYHVFHTFFLDFVIWQYFYFTRTQIEDLLV